MAIWIDADACPVAIKEIIYRASMRTETTTTFVANQPLTLPRSPFLQSIQVSAGFDIADNLIVERAQPGDLVVTSDIPLASEVLAKGAEVITVRGEVLTKDNIKGRLNMRDFMETMRASGIHSGGPAPMNAADKQSFANRLDAYLARHR